MLPENQKHLIYNGLATRFDLPIDQEELEVVEKALATAPRDYYLWCARGILCLGREQGKAIESFSRALSIRPFAADTLYNRGRAFTTLEQYAQAAADFALAVGLDPADPWKLHFLGVALFFLGRYGDALDAFRQSIEMHKHEGADMIPFELDWIWNCHAKLGDRKALEDCMKEVTPDIPIDPHEFTFKDRVLVYAGYQAPGELIAKVPAGNHVRMANQMFCVSNYYYYLKLDYQRAWEALEKVLETKAGGAWGYRMALREQEERRAKAAQ